MRLRLFVADVEAKADEPTACVEIAKDREDAVTPAIAEAAHLYAGEFKLPRLQHVFADQSVEIFQIAMWPVVYADAKFPGLDPGLNGLGESVNLGVGDVEPTELVFVESGSLEPFGDGRGIFPPEDEVGKAIKQLPHAELPERLSSTNFAKCFSVAATSTTSKR